MRILDIHSDAAAVQQLLERSQAPDQEVERTVCEMLARVRTEGDSAVLEFVQQFDCRAIKRVGMQVGKKELRAAYNEVTDGFLRALRTAIRNVSAFHRKQKPPSWTLRRKGLSLQQRFQPLDRVGIYIPGGKGAYLSTVVMNALPARIAGVKEIVMVSPCGADGRIRPEVLVAAVECGVTEVYRIGGVQAIGALAYGTETIRKVDKITGPGNAYVAAAKKQVFGVCGIDMIAGPTEVLIVADDSAPVPFVASDLIAQAEHDEAATPLCVTTSRRFAEALREEVERQVAGNPRAAIARVSLEQRGAIIVVSRLNEALSVTNAIAPEHLEVMLKSPRTFVAGVRHAGSVFVGPWSMEALGDYAAGPNHTLPTSGTARFSSPLGVLDFMKFTNIIQANRSASKQLAPVVEMLAGAEGFPGHAASAAIRRRTA